MKKITYAVLTFILITSLSPLTLAVANEGFNYTVNSKVVVDQDGMAEFDINVTVVDVYAGAQFELMVSEGVTIENVAFDKGTGFSVIPPTYARGSYFFSLIAGANEYEGDLTCTVSIHYGGSEPAQITIVEIQTHYVVSPGNVETTVNDTQAVIEVLPYGYVINDTLIPLAWLRQNWMWIVMASLAVALIITIIMLLRRKNKNAVPTNGTNNDAGNDVNNDAGENDNKK